MNSVTLTGRITKDPEIRYSSNGMASVRFTVAVDRRAARDQNGNRPADFISCVAFGQPADFISRFVKKGNMLAISGRIQTGQYQGQDGQMRYTTDVVCDNVENMSPRDPNQQPSYDNQQAQYNNNGYNRGNYQQQNQNPYQGYNNPQYGSQQQYQAPRAEEKKPESFDINADDEDLPF